MNVADSTVGGAVNVVGNDLITGTINPGDSSGPTLNAIGKDNRQILTQKYVEQEIHNPLPPSPAIKGLDRYLRQLQLRCQALPLGAMGGDEGDGEEISLDQVYIALDTETRVPLSKEEKAKRKANQLALREPEDRCLTALEVATQTRRLVLLGDPGGGKSTFVRQLVARLVAARLGQQPPLPGWPTDLLPLLMVLRDLTPHLAALDWTRLPDEQRDQALLDALHRQWQADLRALSATDLSDSLEDALESGQVLLIFDGLDEVPERMRGAVRLAIRALVNRYRTIARLIVTCRKRSYVGAAVFATFTAHTLAAFDEAKVRDFIAAWYHAQSALGRLSANKAEENSQDLQRAALAPALQELASNPMLLTTMAIIHQREVGLPKERVRLYNLAVQVLLNRWQKRKGLPVSDALAAFLGDELKLRACMERLAYEAHRQKQKNEADLPRPALLVLLEQKDYLGEVGLAGEFLDYVDQRAGLLVGRGGSEDDAHPPSYAFPHRTFQEYLAGCYLISGRGISRAYWQQAAEGDYWYLAAQLGAEELLYNRRSAQVLLDLMYDLCPESAPGDKQAWRAALWSGQMAALLGDQTIRQDDAGPGGGAAYLQRIAPRLCDLLRQSPLTPLERSEAGRVLAKLGDPRVAVLDPLQMEFCFVPAGPFMMGEKGDRDAKQYEHNVTYDYWISRYPVTNAQFATFVAADGYANPAFWAEAQTAGLWVDGAFKGQYDNEPRRGPVAYSEPFSFPNHPVVGVSWYEAIAFTRWLTFQINSAVILPKQWSVHLPNEPEWEKAARGGLQILNEPLLAPLTTLVTPPTGLRQTDNPDRVRSYPWQGEAQPEYANYSATQIGSTSAVGCFPKGKSAVGVEELSGNVWEWTRSLWDEKFRYPYNVIDGRENTNARTDVHRVVRGGAFNGDGYYVRCAFRDRSPPVDRYVDVGFRLVASPLPLSSEHSGL